MNKLLFTGNEQLPMVIDVQGKSNKCIGEKQNDEDKTISQVFSHIFPPELMKIAVRDILTGLYLFSASLYYEYANES